MNVKLIVSILGSLIGGLIITVITGFFHYPIYDLIGSEKWGFPFYWITQTIVPGAEKIINWTNFIINTVIWSSLLFVINYLLIILLIRLKNRISNKKSKINV